MKSKVFVRIAEPRARLDFYELLRSLGRPCFFIRVGLQGPALSDICATPKAAWQNANQYLLASFKPKARRA